MIVVCDTSPISNLFLIGHLYLLPALFHEVWIPPAVNKELLRLSEHGFDPAPIWENKWLIEKAPENLELLTKLLTELDAGEAEAIALAHEQGISTVLIDERLGREVARKNGLEIMGIGGVLLTAKSRGLIPLVRPILDLLREKSRFWLSNSVYFQLLQLAGE